MPFIPEDEFRDLRRFVEAIDELETCVYDTCNRVTGTATPYTVDVDVSQIIDAVERDSDAGTYDSTPLHRYLLGTVPRRQKWRAAILSCSAVYAREATVREAIILEATVLQTVGSRTCTRGIHAARTLNRELLDFLFDKFLVLDNFLDIIQKDSPIGRESRLCDDFQDSIDAIIYISTQRINGVDRYHPERPMNDLVAERVAEIRQQRKALLEAAAEPEPEPKGVVEAYPRRQSRWASSLTGVVSVFSALAMVPGCLGWIYSAHKPGTTRDADFWFLIQNAIMQILSVATILYSLTNSPRLTSEARFWTWGLTASSVVLTIVSVITYVFLPTEWSASFSFLATVMQAFVIIQSLFVLGA